MARSVSTRKTKPHSRQSESGVDTSMNTLERALEHVPQELVVHLVVELHFGSLHKRAEVPRTAVRRSFLQVRVTTLDVRAEQLADPLRFVEVL